jgi:hypothetical protein
MNAPIALTGAALACSVAASCAAAQPLVSLFDASDEGWTVETRSTPAGSFSLIGAFTPDFVAGGGDDGGHLSELDPDGNWSFFLAPDAWNGDRSAFSGRVLRYSTRTDADSYPDGRLVILFGDNGQRLSHDAGIPPLNTWTRRIVPLREGSWFVGTFANGAAATQVQIDAVLADLEALYIGLEFGGDTAEERVDLDRVAFGVCAWDGAEPFGVLDLADINVFVSAFLANTPEADLVPDGIYDLADINAFVAGFMGGCP